MTYSDRMRKKYPPDHGGVFDALIHENGHAPQRWCLLIDEGLMNASYYCAWELVQALEIIK